MIVITTQAGMLTICADHLYLPATRQNDPMSAEAAFGLYPRERFAILPFWSRTNLIRFPSKAEGK